MHEPEVLDSGVQVYPQLGEWVRKPPLFGDRTVHEKVFDVRQNCRNVVGCVRRCSESGPSVYNCNGCGKPVDWSIGFGDRRLRFERQHLDANAFQYDCGYWKRRPAVDGHYIYTEQRFGRQFDE